MGHQGKPKFNEKCSLRRESGEKLREVKINLAHFSEETTELNRFLRLSYVLLELQVRENCFKISFNVSFHSVFEYSL